MDDAELLSATVRGDADALRAALPRSSPRAAARGGRKPAVGSTPRAAVSVVVAATAIGLLSCGRAQAPPAPIRIHPSTTGQAKPHSRARLLAMLGVLRRAQTARDRAFPAAADRNAAPGLTRLAATLADATRVFLAVNLAGGELQAWLISPNGHGYGDLAAGRQAKRGGWTVTMLPDGFAIGSRHAVFISLVPDGVARVRWVFPADPRQGRRSFTLRARDNVAVGRIDERESRHPAAVLWYSAAGHVIRSCTGGACAGG
jgi:hypothetical protein